MTTWRTGIDSAMNALRPAWLEIGPAMRTGSMAGETAGSTIHRQSPFHNLTSMFHEATRV
jgi:hypothetical protein